MKVGDTVVCKQDFSKFSKFFSGKEYYINAVNANDTSVVYISRHTIEDAKIQGLSHYGRWFDEDFSTYFYTKKEMRKLKLKEIESRR